MRRAAVREFVWSAAEEVAMAVLFLLAVALVFFEDVIDGIIHHEIERKLK